MHILHFGEKLNYLKTSLFLTDHDIGKAVNVDTSLVCRWRKGSRFLSRYKDNTATRLAVFLLSQASQRNLIATLAELLSLKETEITAENDDCILCLTDFLYDGKPLVVPDCATANSPAILGIRGVLNVLFLLEQRIRPVKNASVSVYLSLEFSHFLQDPAAPSVWEALFRMNKNMPVRVVVDGWIENTSKAAENLRFLLPFLQTGKLKPEIIKSTHRFFYGNISFFVEEVAMVLTSTPVGEMRDSISTLIESPEYICGMGTVFADLCRRTKPLIYLLPLKEESSCYSLLYEPGANLSGVMGGVSLLYFTEDDYLTLLALNGVNGAEREYRQRQFLDDQSRFYEFIKNHHVQELISLPIIDQMLADPKFVLQSPDFSFHKGAINASAPLLQSLLRRMVEHLHQYENLAIHLECENGNIPQGSACRMKGARYVLLQERQSNENHAVCSDHWMMVNEYIRQFHIAKERSSVLVDKTAVISALQARLE